MKRINKRFFSIIASAAITLNMTAVCNSDNFTVNAGQQLGQTDFENGVGLPWHICESGPGKMDFEIDKGVYTVTIVNAVHLQAVRTDGIVSSVTEGLRLLQVISIRLSMRLQLQTAVNIILK